MSKQKRVAAVGFCCADVYENLNEWYPTGNGVDFGVHLARAGVPVSVVSVVGNDEYGEQMKAVLEKEGIDISHLRTEEGQTCRMRMELKNGTDRVHLESVDGVMEHYAITKEDFAFVAEHDLLHTDLFGNVLSYLPAWKEACVEILMDFSVFTRDPQYECEKLFPFVDYVFFSADGIPGKELTGWMKKIQSYGPKLVTATMGEEGSLCYNGEFFYSWRYCTGEKCGQHGGRRGQLYRGLYEGHAGRKVHSGMHGGGGKAFRRCDRQVPSVLNRQEPYA